MAKERKVIGRRDFLRKVGLGASAAAGAGTFAGKVAADTESPDEKRKARYRETEHVKTYYRVNRYPQN